jgi:FHS family Na+ dependent glucose MFS transporter 1
MAAYLCVGSIAALVPSLLPSAIREFRLPLAVAGRIFPAMAVGSLVGGLLAGVCSDRIGRRPFVVGSATLVAVWLLIASCAHTWLAFMGAFLLVGLAQGALSIGLNALVMDLNARRHGKAINTLHGMYSLGATVSPLLIARLLGGAQNWRTPLIWAASAWLLLSGITALFRYPTSGTIQVRTPALRFNLLRLGQRSALLPLFALAFLYNGVSWSLLGWVKVYVQQQGVRSSLLSGGMISLFYAALTVGRFSCAHLSERLGYSKTLLLCAVGASCCYPLVAFGGNPVWTAAGTFLSGLFLSGLYPTALAYATRRFPEIAGTIAGSMAAALTVGSMLPPWWTGVVAGAHGLPFAIKLNYALVVPLIGIALYLRRRE